jgi:phage tail sheath protein FI
MSSDPEWKYVNVRRLFIYLEHSIDKSTQWAVFEPNNEALWANIRQTITDFLLVTWRTGALMGSKPEEAFFVRCDRTTMTQNDLDNGRLICLIGVAPTYPAEFVIFRIGQFTASAQQS